MSEFSVDRETKVPMKHKAVLASLILVTVVFSVPLTYASVPKIHSMEMDRAGSDVIVTIEIAHQLGSESHYVDIVETTMGGRTLNFTNLVHQTSYRFFVNGTYNNTDIGELRVRAHCVTHGWSNWTQIARLSSNVAYRAAPKEPIWYPLVVPLIMMSLLVLMKWRKMIP